MIYKPSKLGKTDLVCDQSSSVGLQDYKSLSVVVIICAILVNTETHRQIDFDLLYY